jgi:MerR family mercuric resistance operon transcriptional regulator
MLKPTASRSGRGIAIGPLAETAEVNVETIRYYQRIGLLPLPKRNYGRIRRYSVDDLMRVRFIKRAQALGFSLDEVALLLGLSDGKHCAETKALAQKKLAMVEEKIADLAAIQKALKGLVTQCAKGSRGCGCPIIDALVKDESG